VEDTQGFNDKKFENNLIIDPANYPKPPYYISKGWDRR
jgi:hypothetical protein